MADLVYMARSAWTALLDSIRSKGGTNVPMTAAQAKAAVEAIETGGGAIDLFDPDSPAGAVVSTFSGNTPSYGCAYRTAITSIHLINAKSVGQYGIWRCSALTIFVGELVNSIANYGLSANTQLTTIDILGGDGVCPFASGGSGGTIYIHKALYDHLGDGTELDYKAATNWSTVDGYGTVTWAQIEGSYYETHYADGTPVT